MSPRTDTAVPPLTGRLQRTRLALYTTLMAGSHVSLLPYSAQARCRAQRCAGNAAARGAAEPARDD
ncbi:hypothetical protein ACGFYM_36155 [Streptomyces sp. NPDC048231]|uniref:hypothetical protein n=1 Tax=Streptomyces sp. NPDC048231 TaxID=3365519 RepID=UPI0037112064